ncbi:MAG: hypothetical protein AAGJ82_12375 [Bacteroidota bacterium]
MDLQRTKRLLDKINALHNSISVDNQVSSIERDLLLSYIRQFYDACHSDAPTRVDQRVAPAPAPVRVDPTPPAAKPVAAAPPPPPPVVETPPPTPAPPPPAPKPTPAPVRVDSTPKTAQLTPELAALFQHQAAKELSEKLSQQRITDLTKALSINDKLLYANELFGRDMARMNGVLQEINGLKDMEAAKAMLGEIAATNNWANEERTDIAKSFIKLVRRKFS